MRTLRWLVPLLALGFIAYAVGTSYRNWIRTDPLPVMTIPPNRIRLEVVNGSGDIGAGRDVREYLSRRGFDMYDDKNNDEILLRTQIVDRVDSTMKYAREVQKALTVPARRIGPWCTTPARRPGISSRIDRLLYLDGTVLLGADYRSFFPVEPRPY